jgi:hypothetical protein
MLEFQPRKFSEMGFTTFLLAITCLLLPLWSFNEGILHLCWESETARGGLLYADRSNISPDIVMEEAEEKLTHVLFNLNGS